LIETDDEFMNLAEFLRVLDGEFERNILVGEGIVHAGESLQLGLDVHLVLGVKVDLEGLGTINLVTDALAHNLGGVADVLQNLLMDMCEGAGSGAGSLLHSLAVEALGKNGALGNNDDMLATVNSIAKKEDITGKGLPKHNGDNNVTQT
jgi:hypothetical protein